MEEYVKDMILGEEFTDLVLLRLVELTMYSIRLERPLFPEVLEEPVFFRKYFHPWVREALEEKDRLRAMMAENEGNYFK